MVTTAFQCPKFTQRDIGAVLWCCGSLFIEQAFQVTHYLTYVSPTYHSTIHTTSHTIPTTKKVLHCALKVT